MQGWLAGRQPKLQYEVLDLQALVGHDPRGQDAESWGIGEEDLERVKSLEEAEMVYHAIEELKEQYRLEGLGRGRTEGRAEGRVEGGATMACRLARRKFGAETAERLSQLLEGITEPERIDRIGDRIIECETGAELLARARDD